MNEFLLILWKSLLDLAKVVAILFFIYAAARLIFHAWFQAKKGRGGKGC